MVDEQATQIGGGIAPVVGGRFTPVQRSLLPPTIEPIPVPEEELTIEEGLEEQATPATGLVEEGVREVNGEDLSDLFDVNFEDVMGDTEEGLADLTEVSEEDVMGEGGAAGLDDLVDVSYEDIMGYDYAPPAKVKRGAVARVSKVARTPPPTSMRGQQQ